MSDTAKQRHGDTAMRTIGRSLPGLAGGSRAWGLVALLIVLASPAMDPAAAPDLPEALNLRGYPAGERPPEFSGRTPNGQTISLAGLRGRVVLVNFWATWCLECRPEMPMFERLHRDFASRGLTVLGINVREDISAIRGYAKELRLTFPLVLDASGEISRAYGVIGLPTTFLVGRDGRAVARAIGAREWEGTPARKLLEALLAEPSPRKDTR